MLTIVVLLFATAAVFGLINISKVLKKTNPPSAVVFSHGAAAATALVLFIVYAVQNPGAYPQWSLILFIVAALGGFTLVYNDRVRKKPGPAALAIIHAFVAVTAFIGLLLFVLS